VYRSAWAAAAVSTVCLGGGKPLKRLGRLAAHLHRAEAAVLMRWALGTVSSTAPPGMDEDEFFALDEGLQAYPRHRGCFVV
jgi:hypothetical protein